VKAQQTNRASPKLSKAAKLAALVQQEMVSPALTKDDRSPVTVADFAVQALTASELQKAFPDASLVGEEDADALRSPEESATLEQVQHFVSQEIPEATEALVCDWIDFGGAEPSARFWTLDPVDGTKGFLRGEQYAVALALIEDGEVQIAALGCPNLSRASEMEIGGEGSLLIAVRGEGCWVQALNGEGELKALQVSAQDNRSRARLMLSAEAAHTNLGNMDLIAQQLGIGAEPVRMDSQAKYAVLAAGEGELLFRLISPKSPDYREKIWDQAAGSLVVEEAGGKITDLDGKMLNFNDLDGKMLNFKLGRTLAENRGVLASNGQLHAEALEAIRAVGA
jgi:3'(2'), 5'-bisphosphate nucleotidase